MRSAARWGFAGGIAVVLACTGPRGPQGDPGPPGPEGPPGRLASINGLDGGTVNSAVTIGGDLTAGGHLLTWPRSPSLVSGITPQGCGSLSYTGGTQIGTANGMAIFPLRTQSANPVVLAQIDESGDKWGAVSVRSVRPASNRVSFRCNDNADAIHWLAMDPSPAGSSWQLPGGLQIEAGIYSLPTAGATGQVSFDVPFSQEPVVLLTLEEPGALGNAINFARVIMLTTNTGFTYLLENAPAADLKLHWVALGTADGNFAPPPWTFTHGRYRWTAGFIPEELIGCSLCTFDLPNSPLLTAPNVFLTVHDTDNVNVPNYARILGVSTSQLMYQLQQPTERVNYLILEDLP